MVDKKIRVLIVDDSQLIRDMFSDFLSQDAEIEVIGTAYDPYDAREKIKSLHPDVLTLDVEMPKMDGLSFLEKIMTLRPMPVVMVSTLTLKGADITLRALEIGAVDAVAKPENGLHSIKDELITKVKNAARAKVSARISALKKPESTAALSYHGRAANWLVAIGSSTGGVEALRDIVEKLPANIPPMVVTQHMPPIFTASFAKRMDSLAAPTIREAQDGMEITPGTISIAPGGLQMEVIRKGGKLFCHVYDGPNVSGHKPSVDVLFSSVAALERTPSIGVILTGMGSDGAKGLLAMRKAGAKTLGQNEASCVVYGMPKAAYNLGGVEKEVALSEIPLAILQRCV